MVDVVQPLDLFTLFNHFVFGNFWVSTLGLIFLMFVILGVLGRVSIYTTTWFNVMFFLAMSLGYGMVIYNVLITSAVFLAFIFSWRNYLER